ncbi:hypothetical protein IMZ38_05115 [Thermosphaera chiliense]|uniref:Uncharacterized protein n=1 Tax=Thermosphaera chiliense TaxID=3402707 RepID=A0A7M1UTB8_9CREN|nr:hypothetical protein [Thermosphaera aggregans]QOR94024.1 hypothetical protein IMZ38_05115 [Thermosphaera aggregans]
MKPLVKLMTLLGLPPVAGIILSVLLTSGTPLDLTELSRKTGYAKSHLSQTLKLLYAREIVDFYVERKKKYFIVNNQGLLKALREHINNLIDSLNQLANLTENPEFLKLYLETFRDIKGEHNVRR